MSHKMNIYLIELPLLYLNTDSLAAYRHSSHIVAISICLAIITNHLRDCYEYFVYPCVPESPFEGTEGQQGQGWRPISYIIIFKIYRSR
jgi:hypothetical protein